MFTLPAVVASIALKESTNAFEAHWEAGPERGGASPRRVPLTSRLTGLLTLIVAYYSR